jgi:flagellar protein FliJ
MAKKFEFRLEKVLNLRSQKVSQEKIALGRVQSIRLLKEQEMQEQEDYTNQINRQKSLKANAAMFQALQSHKSYIREEMVKLSEEVVQLREIEKLRRIRLNDAMVDEKVLEKLKERKHSVHIEEVKREETNLLDEIASDRIQRRKSTI